MHQEKNIVNESNKANNDLNDFLYIISHDFNAPLRHMKEFTNLLIKKLDGKLGESELKYADMIQNSVAHTEAMLESLLKLSRLNTQGKPFSQFEIQAILSEIENSSRLHNQNFTINHSNLPTIFADKGQIITLFSELIDNSIKFSTSDATTQINISCAKNDSFYEFTFKDNGNGFEPSIVKDAFKIFRKYHANDTISGIGLGLALCNKIVEIHCGSIWLDSNTNSIHFTIPV